MEFGYQPEQPHGHDREQSSGREQSADLSRDTIGKLEAFRFQPPQEEPIQKPEDSFPARRHPPLHELASADRTDEPSGSTELLPSKGFMEATRPLDCDLDHLQILDDELLSNTTIENSPPSPFEMDDVDLDSLEDITQYIFEKQAEEAEQRTRNAKPRKKSAQQIREEEEHANASRSVREIYRKLVSALHPDRETDAVERERKTVMMQRVNQAYTDNNLLALLQLQLEIEQIDHSHINSIAEGQLKHYNRVLINQLDELQHEVSELTLAFKRQFNLPPGDNITPANVTRKFPKKLRELRTEIQTLKEQREALEDPRALKSWLKEQRHVLDMEAYLSGGMPDDFIR